MKRLLIVLFVASCCLVATYGQCDMRVDYSAERFNETVKAVLTMTLPDGNKVTLLNDTARKAEKSYPLKHAGEYQLTAYFYGGHHGCDSLSRRFSLTGDEYNVETTLHFYPTSNQITAPFSMDSIAQAHFTITKHTPPSPLVTIKYIGTNDKEDSDIPGPVFEVHNESPDTLYGEHLPGYFWGTLSVWNGSEYTRNLSGIICTTYVDEPPLYPHLTKNAWVGSSGIRSWKGKFRFNLYYSTENKTKGSAPFYRQSKLVRWFSVVEEWHLLTCEFAVN